MEYAVDCHKSTNHLYDGDKPYSHHLSMVVGVAADFIHLIPEKDQENVLAACWCHDVIEDCRQTYNDVMKETNKAVAEIVYAVSNEKGKSRTERANEKYYSGIVFTPYASFVKICDRIANYEYSVSQNSPMVGKYQKEMYEFVKKLWVIGYEGMFLRLGVVNLEK